MNMVALRFITQFTFLLFTINSKATPGVFEDLKKNAVNGLKTISDTASELEGQVMKTIEDEVKEFEPVAQRVTNNLKTLKNIPDDLSKGKVGKAFDDIGKAVSGLGEVIESDTSIAGFVTHHILDTVEKAFEKYSIPGYSKFIKVGILVVAETFNETFDTLVGSGFLFLANHLSYEDYQHMSEILLRLQIQYEPMSTCVFVRVKQIMKDNCPDNSGRPEEYDPQN